MFIAIDGIDGAGKTTLAQQIVHLLADYRPLLEKEPTDYTRWGKRLKESAIVGRLSKETELEYFHKDRLYHLERIIEPALNDGRVVVVDRYVDSTLAFQAETIEEAKNLYQRFLPEIKVPDVTFILDCPPDVGLTRIANSRCQTSSFERFETLKRAHKIYRSRRGPNYHHIDATGSIQCTLAAALEILVPRGFPELSAELDRISASGHECSRQRASL